MEIHHYIPELGNLALTFAFGFALALSIVPFWGVRKNNHPIMELAPNLVVGQFIMTAISFGCLVYAFATDDFSVINVAQNSTSLLPFEYKIAASWGSHEGSILLWLLMQSCWNIGFAVFSKQLPKDTRTLVLVVLGWISVGFYAYVIIASNPFERTLPYFPVDGRDLNPLLQDPGMIFHPPMLYLGYVGMSVPFSFAIAALILGRLDTSWAKWSRPWTLLGISCLTMGITLGSWWAYSELGWGGWWFWDPSENAAFMPWLVAVALFHSLIATEKRGVFVSWTLFLAIAAFSFSLLGTFLVRSGVIVSVHAFANDPERGIFILGLLAFVIGGSLTLYAMRITHVQKDRTQYAAISRETTLLMNNMLFIAATIVVLIGTLFPMLHKQAGLGAISVGQPFFDQVFSWLLIPFSFVLGVAPMMRWKQDNLNRLFKSNIYVFVVSLILGLAWVLGQFGQWNFTAIVSASLGCWITLISLRELFKTAQKLGWAKIPKAHWGMIIGHIGFAVTLAGGGMATQFTDERAVKMHIGDKVELSGYTFHLKDIEATYDSNYEGHGARIEVLKGNQPVGSILSEKRFYTVQKTVMTEAGVDVGFTRDLYVSLGTQFDDGSWGVRLYVKHYVRWLWAGGILIAIGLIIAIADKRYRRKTGKLQERAA
ncbi:heme lyase CcmF/NrfE family subunit [Aestuariibacter sp. AA17]|uniref:Heme lyase CcmF/NrfE family subunit n=1 Tax=Fluctibacter corallii TaxID=2984329 RepID=A0ABT3A4X5_9ALTE|nr:heme lyase CcmF/NrfE family subunit [Aestuariibacter sp. AA17]MCV2883743.1 heme lyase CcmF/NrfE family subunit [Aestuariibacter sp. AA17]